MRVAYPVQFDRVLARFSQGAAIGAEPGTGPRLLQPPPGPVGGAVAVDQHSAALDAQPPQCGTEGFHVVDPHALAQMGAQLRPHLAGLDEQIDAAVGVQQGETQCDRHVGNVAAAYVEQPRHGFRRTQQCGIEASGAQVLGHQTSFLGRLDARIFHPVRDHRGRGRRGTVEPRLVDRVARTDHQPSVRFLAGGAQPDDLIGGMEPRIVAEPPAGRQVLADPLGGGLIGQVAGFEQCRVDLFAGLERVAAVDEQRGAIFQDHRHPGRAGESGQPGEAFGTFGDEFALVLVGTWNEETGQPSPPNMVPDRFHAVGDRGAAAVGRRHHALLGGFNSVMHNPGRCISFFAESLLLDIGYVSSRVKAKST